MLHALLHHKLDESVPEPQRLEDALTSTVFGTLLLLERWDIVARWLKLTPLELASASTGPPHPDLWFWPRMAFAVPDVVLRLGDLLVIVEAKYGSGRHDLTAADEDEQNACDQLVRQYRSVVTPPDGRTLYVESLENAIHECAFTQVFLVDGRRRRRAEREFYESKGRLPERASLVMVTWQSLYRLLTEPPVQDLRWAVDLRSYLDMSGLGTFSGFGKGGMHLRRAGCVTGWRIRRTSNGFAHAATNVSAVTSRSLEGWRAPELVSAVDLSSAVHPSVVSELTMRSVSDWHAPPVSRVGAANSPVGRINK